jgi:two-component system heavy metal sensor histidine kinase CusS
MLSRQRVEEGTGLGLAITKSILDVHGASIQATITRDIFLLKLSLKISDISVIKHYSN